MANYIKNPMTNPNWNPTMGDYFSQSVHEEDLQYEKKQRNKKIMIALLVSFHFIGLATMFLLY